MDYDDYTLARGSVWKQLTGREEEQPIIGFDRAKHALPFSLVTGSVQRRPAAGGACEGGPERSCDGRLWGAVP